MWDALKTFHAFSESKGVFRFLCCSVEGRHKISFQSENAVFPFFRRIINRYKFKVTDTTHVRNTEPKRDEVLNRYVNHLRKFDQLTSISTVNNTCYQLLKEEGFHPRNVSRTRDVFLAPEHTSKNSLTRHKMAAAQLEKYIQE